MTDFVNLPTNNFQAGKQFRTIPILLVEDDYDDSDIVAEAISDISPIYTLTWMDRTDKAISFLESLTPKELPALIILDLNLPPMTGVEFLKFVKADDRFKDIPVAIYSHSTYQKHIDEVLQAGACVYFNKKNSTAAIQADIKQMLTYCNPAVGN
jgi:CheY-like chemotaxis protein